MTGIIITMGFDIVLTILLAIMISFCWKLNARIRILQDSKSELAKLIREFDEATARATSSIVEIQQASKRISENIQIKLEKANYLADDLTFLIERAGKISAGGPSASSVTSPASKKPSAMPHEAPGARENNLSKPAVKQSSSAALEAMLGKLGARDENAVHETGNPLRSKAEQELLDALKGR